MTRRRSAPDPDRPPNRGDREPHRPPGRPDRTARTRILDGRSGSVDEIDGTDGDSRSNPRRRRAMPPPTRPTRSGSLPRTDDPPVRLTVVPGGRDPRTRRSEPEPQQRRSERSAPASPDPPARAARVDRVDRAQGAERADRADRPVRRARSEHRADRVPDRTDVPRRLRIRGWMPAAALLLVLLGVSAMVIAQPLRQWRDQQNDISSAQRRLDDVRAERELVQDLTEDLRSDASIRRHARELLDMVDPGEDLVIVLPPGSPDLGLPDTWPFTGVERELGMG